MAEKTTSTYPGPPPFWSRGLNGRMPKPRAYAVPALLDLAGGHQARREGAEPRFIPGPREVHQFGRGVVAARDFLARQDHGSACVRRRYPSAMSSA